MNIAVFLFGSLGDTLVALPALWAIRKQYPDDRITILSDVQIGRSLIGARQILDGSGVADDVFEYASSAQGGHAWQKIRGFASLWRKLRALRPDLLVYLVRGPRDQPRISRDRLFFRSAGVSAIIGIEGMPGSPPSHLDGRLPALPSQADQFLVRLASAGLPVPPPGQGRCDLGLQESDYESFRMWAKGLPPDGARRWVAFAPGSKMPSKQWPEDRFRDVGHALIASHDIWPVVFGGGDDCDTGKRLLEAWGRGHMAAGSLGVRPAAVALGRCSLYVGNDTGTMHLAASAGIRCVALFSSRDYPGLWDPYGAGHCILRTDPPCAGCFGIVCPRGDNMCLCRIPTARVVDACQAVLGEGSAAASSGEGT